DGDGYGNPDSTIQSCAHHKGYVRDSTDCNDHDINTHPDAVEIADGLDNNCDGQRDEGFPQFTFYQDLDKDGYGNPKVFISANVAPPGYVSNNLDCNDNDKTIYPGAPELCDGKDNNCNGIIDDGLPLKRFYLDSDKDKYGNVKYYKYACAAPAGYVADSTDCNDKNAAVHPGAAEIPGNGIDDNCNGLIDETTTTISANGMELYPEEESPLSVAVHPNPGISYFTVSINAVGAKLVQLRVFDELGRVVESKNNLNPKTTITIGHHYTPGIYFMEAVQGNKRVILKLMKS
ncbi:MAG: MopE-related protein, partial [Flavisolibacter sp.]